MECSGAIASPPLHTEDFGLLSGVSAKFRGPGLEASGSGVAINSPRNPKEIFVSIRLNQTMKSVPC